MIARMYEVLLHAEIPTRMGAKGRWYLACAHPDMGGAERAFHALGADFPSPKVTIALVRSEPDPATGLFVDRVVKARGRVPLIRREAMERFDKAARATVAAAAPPPSAMPEISLAGTAFAQHQPRQLPWPWIASAAIAAGFFAALRGGIA